MPRHPGDADPEGSITPPEAVGRYMRERRALIETADPGPESARQLSMLTDRVVVELADASLRTLTGHWAVLAVGGWGAGRLLPGSDLDLLVLADCPPEHLRPALERMLYPLWDAGLDVGHQVRTRSDHLRSIRRDLITLTATLTGQTLCGDRALAEGVLDAAASDARRRRARLLPELASRPRPGSPYLLEPDLKEGAGGQRDLDELTWTAAVLSGAPSTGPGPLVALGLLSPDELARLEAAAGVLTAARWALHVTAGATRSLLDLDTASEAGIDLHALQPALADIHHILLRVRGRVAGQQVPGDAASCPPLEAQALFAALDAGRTGLPDLEDAAWSGRLDDLLPGMSVLMTLRRPALTHTLTVGAHSLLCAALVGDAPPRNTAATRGRVASADRRTVQAAALLHDVGKVQAGPGHAGRGAAMAATVVPRLGLDEHQAADAAMLVREHLLLAETAFTQDIHDEDVIVRTASAVRHAALVDDLYALTAADSMATGPGAWTTWHAALVGELADRLAAALTHDSLGADAPARAERTRAGALRLVSSEDRAQVDAFIRHAPLRYLARRRPEDVVAHARLAAEALGAAGTAGPRTAVTPGPVPGTWTVTVAAPDHQGLFGEVAGALALAGLDILSADAHSSPSGAAVDTFVTRPDTLAEASPATWAAFERYLVAASAGHLDLDARLTQRRRHYPAPAPRAPIVSVEPTAAYATAVYVTATDRVGLLHDIARAIAECGLDIRLVRATTRGGTARDVFHVVDAGDQPLDDPGVLGHLAMRIRERA